MYVYLCVWYHILSCILYALIHNKLEGSLHAVTMNEVSKDIEQYWYLFRIKKKLIPFALWLEVELLDHMVF